MTFVGRARLSDPGHAKFGLLFSVGQANNLAQPQRCTDSTNVGTALAQVLRPSDLHETMAAIFGSPELDPQLDFGPRMTATTESSAR